MKRIPSRYRSTAKASRSSGVARSSRSFSCARSISSTPRIRPHRSRRGTPASRRCRTLSSGVAGPSSEPSASTTRLGSTRWKNAAGSSPPLARRTRRGPGARRRRRGPAGRRSSPPGGRSARRGRRPRRRGEAGTSGPSSPFDVLAAPCKPMSATWCWPHVFGQPRDLDRRRREGAERVRRSGRSSRSPIARASARDAVTARLHVSAPGHEVTSRAVCTIELGEVRARERRVNRRERPRVDPGDDEVLIDASGAASRRRSAWRAPRARAAASIVTSPREGARRPRRTRLLLVERRRRLPREIPGGARPVLFDRAARGSSPAAAPRRARPSPRRRPRPASSAYSARKPSSPSFRRTYFRRARCLFSRLPSA